MAFIPCGGSSSSECPPRLRRGGRIAMHGSARLPSPDGRAVIVITTTTAVAASTAAIFDFGALQQRVPRWRPCLVDAPPATARHPKRHNRSRSMMWRANLLGGF